MSSLLDSKDSAQRISGVRILGQMSDPRFIRSLVNYLQDPDPQVRRWAAASIEGLAHNPMPDWVKALTLEAMLPLLNDPVERIRLSAVTALQQIGGAQTQAGLVLALKDSSRLVRRRSVEALQSLGAQVAPDLEKLLQSNEQDLCLQEKIVTILAYVDRERFADFIDRRVEHNLQASYQMLIAWNALDALDQNPAMGLLRDTLRERISQRLDRFLDLAMTGWVEETSQIVTGNLYSPAQRVRANAIEALESLTSPRIGRLITPLVSLVVVAEFSVQEALDLAHKEWALESPASF